MHMPVKTLVKWLTDKSELIAITLQPLHSLLKACKDALGMTSRYLYA